MSRIDVERTLRVTTKRRSWEAQLGRSLEQPEQSTQPLSERLPSRAQVGYCPSLLMSAEQNGGGSFEKSCFLSPYGE